MGLFKSVKIEHRRSSCSSCDGHHHDNETEMDEINWGALERLPTVERAHISFLHGVAGDFKEVDVKRLDFYERRALLNKLVTNMTQNELFLHKIKTRFERVSLAFPSIEVRFRNLNVETYAYVGSRALPTIYNSLVNMVEGVINFLKIQPSQKRKLQILSDLNGIIKPGRMTLLLGPPSSGKTTLLLALAGLLDSELTVSGKVTYNGHEFDEFVPQRCSAYVSQNDVHICELTVRETLSFSATCQGLGSAYELLLDLLRKEKELDSKPDPLLDVLLKASAMEKQRRNLFTEYILKVLGLEECADTIIGDQMTRGISGGQKRRTTIGEMIVGPTNAYLMDSISVGLDSSTTYDIINSIRQSVHIMHKTALISLLQPPAETFELFDDIILMSEGQIVYQGPRFYVLHFFESLGFRCPQRKPVADYLQEVISRKDQAQYWAREDEEHAYVSTKQFADKFKEFHIGIALQTELNVPFDKSRSHPFALTKTKFGTNKMVILKACVSREFLLMKRNFLVFCFKLLQLGVLGLVVASAFCEDKKHDDRIEDGTVQMGALFILLVTIILSGLAVIPMTINKLPVYYKQKNFLFYPSWAYSFPSLIPGMIFSMIEVLILVLTTYFIIGFDPNFFRFIKHGFMLILCGQMSYCLFRCVGAVTRDNSIANVVANLTTMWLVIFSGYVLTRVTMKKWLVWGYWTSPLMYVYNAISANEFLGKSWSKNHLLDSNETKGVSILKFHGVTPNPNSYLVGIIALIGFIILFALLANLALAYLKPFGQSPSTAFITKEEEEKTSTTEDTTQNRSNSTGLSFTPLCMTFEDIIYSVDMPKEKKERGNPNDRLVLLNGVSGCFRPGVLTVLMGVTGAGKTTLLDVLAGRKNTGYMQGTIKVSGYTKKQDTFARVSGYFEQNDIHSPFITVSESIVFSASLRLPKDINSKAKQNFVEEIMELMELTPIKDALVGQANVNGLSVEQRKRLTIAVELVANPSILFMDEPTSGLDARAAAIVMRVVRNTVNTGRTVVCTIHQPSIHIFESFDELFLLKQGGHVLYAGPIGYRCAQLITYFEQIDGVPKIREGHNPATWVLEATTKAQEERLGLNFSYIYLNSELYRANMRLIGELSIPPPNSEELHFATSYCQSYFIQWKTCLWKQYKSYWRNTAHNGVRFVITSASAFMFGIVFFQIGSRRDTQVEVLGGIGAIYISTMFMGAQTSTSVMPVMSSDKLAFYRERSSGLYSPIPYALAQVAIEIPYVVAQTTIFEIIAYAMMGFEWSAMKFFQEYLFMLLSLLYFTYFGMMVSSITPNQETCSILASFVFSLWNLFAGFAIPKKRIPVWWRWYTWVCPVSWSMNGLVSCEYGDNTESKLESGETVTQFLMDYFGYKYELLGIVIAVLVGFNLLFIFLHCFSIKMFNFQKR
ncbi:ABC transporter G family member 39-like [Amaranthus tricolor]|uniref:ABC transporter G family member 39-like n=1 Tax=Amaranthus tricolor TaxID=29722 RepID=UPI002588B18F|nr:ABC transporter G family member 39-like [Amaranthus tricolor]